MHTFHDLALGHKLTDVDAHRDLLIDVRPYEDGEETQAYEGQPSAGRGASSGGDVTDFFSSPADE